MNTTRGRTACLAAVSMIAVVAGTAWSQFGRQTIAAAPRENRIQRFGSVIGLKPELKDEYVRLHAACWPAVLDRIKKCNIRNYSIYQAELDGKLYLFSYFEYVGDDFERDMAQMKADAKTREWWTHTDPCQIRLPGTKSGSQWLGIPEVFHAD